MKKYTIGIVEQVFDENAYCISQRFIAGDEVQYEDDGGDPYVGDEDYLASCYHPFDMVQPPCGQKHIDYIKE